MLNLINNALWLGVPDLIKGLIVSIGLVLLFKTTIKTHSFLFYLYPGFIFLWYCTYGILDLCNVDLYGFMGETIYWELLWLPHSYGLDTSIGLGFVFIVMFTGVLPKWNIVKQLYIIRKELSIISGLLLVGHGVMRLPTMKWAFENMKDINIFLIFSYGILGVILLVLIFIPWITSFQFARKRLQPKTWKKLQTYTSVPLIILICIFGIAVNLGWALSVLPDLSTNLWEVTKTADGTPVSDLSQGYQVAASFLSARIYFILMTAYIWLRVKKNHKTRSAIILTRTLSPNVREPQEF